VDARDSYFSDFNTDTIAAPATASGTGATACIRVSGRDAVAIADTIFRGRRKLADSDARKSYFGGIADGDDVIDEVMATVFRAPHSYTGEDTVEISCHGSPYIVQRIVSLLLANGCRLARAGEFTQRAFLNGKMDLSQAEAVADLIASTSAAAHRIAMSQMRGDFSGKLAGLRKQLLDFASLIELELDFADEDVVFADRAELAKLTGDITAAIRRLVDSFSTGNVIKNGVPVVIVGETNTGKSTLLNLLLHDEKAIVSDIHGTTRDFIEDCINIHGITFRFIDTAGIRETDDAVETLGIERTFRRLNEAYIVVWLADATDDNLRIRALADKILSLCKDKKLLLVFNKTDLATDKQIAEKQQFMNGEITNRLFISALHDINIDALREFFVSAVNAFNLDSQYEVTVTSLRHYEALKNALSAIENVREGLCQNLSGDLLAQDIRLCINRLGEITGEITNDEVLGNIFAKFCIGK
jgi:tRNA modification GTPase